MRELFLVGSVLAFYLWAAAPKPGLVALLLWMGLVVAAFVEVRE